MPDHFDVGSRRKFAERRLLSPIARPRRSAGLIAIDEADVALKHRNLTMEEAASLPLVKRLGVDVVIDYKSEKFETLLSGYDVALNSLAGDKGVTFFQRTMSRLMREADRS